MRSAGFLALDWEKIGTKLYGYVLAKRYTSLLSLMSSDVGPAVLPVTVSFWRGRGKYGVGYGK